MSKAKPSVVDDAKLKKALELSIKKNKISGEYLESELGLKEFEALWLIYTMHARGWLQIAPMTTFKSAVSSFEQADKVWHENSQDNDQNDSIAKELEATQIKLSNTEKQGKIVITILIIIIIVLIFK